MSYVFGSVLCTYGCDILFSSITMFHDALLQFSNVLSAKDLIL